MSDDSVTARLRDPAAEVWADMRARRAQGRPARVEDFLGGPELSADDPDLVLDLIYGEFALREQAGEAPRAAEYAARFPHLAERIARQIDMHAALSSASTGPADYGTVTFAGSNRRDEPTKALPEWVGKYRVVALLGAGGQATVYRAVHPTLGLDVVVKVCHRRVAADSPDGHRLTVEGRILAGLSHPHLARVYDLDVDDGRPFLAMEHVPGRNLEQAARHARPTPRDAARLVAQLAQALAHAHARGAVHLDLKPANVLVGDDGMPRLIDFGLGRLRLAWEENADSRAEVSGTLAYMPPERAAGAADQSPERADVFGLGGVLYFLLTGHPPFSGLGAADVWDKARAGSWDQASLDRSAAPRRVRDVCRRCLTTDPAARYGSAAAVAADLGRFAQGPRTARRVAVCVGFVALIACGVAVTLRPTPPTPLPANDVRLTAPAALAEASVQVEVWEGGRHRELIHCLPLRAGDAVRVEGKRPAGFHAVLLWADTDGAVHELASGRPGDEETVLRYPPAAPAVKLRGPAGTEVVLLCARRDRPVDVAAVRVALGGVKGWPALPSMAYLRLTTDGVQVVNAGKGPGELVNGPDPVGDVRERLEALRRTLAGECDVVAALAVAHE